MHAQIVLPCIHLCSFINQEAGHLCSPMKGCQVERGVAILILVGEGWGIFVDQVANNPKMQGEGEMYWLST